MFARERSKILTDDTKGLVFYCFLGMEGFSHGILFLMLSILSASGFLNAQ